MIGCEYASIFCNLDVKVNLVNTRDQLLSFLDTEITDALSYHLRHQGVVIRNNEDYASVEARNDGVILHCKSGKNSRPTCCFGPMVVQVIPWIWGLRRSVSS